MSHMDRIAELLDEMFASGVGSAGAVSVGDAGVEVARLACGAFAQGGAQIDERARFDVASLTKPMVTAAIAMALVADGRLDLDRPIRDVLADAASTGTIAQLLGHAAGCAAHVEFFREPLTRALLGERARRHPAGAPGVAALYSDLGYIMLGNLLERVGGAPLEQLFADRVATPLGLSARFGPVDDAVATEGVQGIVHDENARFAGGICGHAGLFATIDDLARFAAALVGGRFHPAVLQRFATTSAAPGASWRLGWDTPSRTPGVSHAGDRWPREHAIGHLGFTGTSLWLDLAHGRWVALLTNRVHPTREGSADAIKRVRRGVNDAALDLIAAAELARRGNAGR